MIDILGRGLGDRLSAVLGEPISAMEWEKARTHSVKVGAGIVAPEDPAAITIRPMMRCGPH